MSFSHPIILFLDCMSVWWDAQTGDCDEVQGTGHTNQVTDMAVCENTLVSVGVDDMARFTNILERQYM